jgi:glycogen debranching enzyme
MVAKSTEADARARENGTTRRTATSDAPTASALDLPSAADVEQLVRAEGTLFLVTDRSGDIAPSGARELGLFFRDTRFLSHYAMHVGVGQVVRLSAETTHDGFNQVDLMVSDVERADILDDPKNYLHIRRRQMLDGGLVEQIVFTNFLQHRVDLEVSFSFGVDFADIFEVRGARRARRGKTRPPRIETAAVIHSYDGLDGGRYESTIAFGAPPSELTAGVARFELSFAAGEAKTLEIAVTPSHDPAESHARLRGRPFQQRTARLEQEADDFREGSTRFVCDNARIQVAFDQAISDLHDLRVHFGAHEIIGAGIPWFCAPFGRDALITSYEALMVNPGIAEQSLRTLAAFQGKKYDDTTEEEPGKIFHELRFGEMARAKEIPHSPYYGSVDATPLFVVVVDALHRVMNRRSLLRELEPAVVAALEWIDARSENGTRLVTYAKKSAMGLDNQGWKDSRAGVSFPDGRRAAPPIALCEVQGYCADAYRRGARVLEAVGDHERAAIYGARAQTMSELIEREMWLEDRGRYAFAVDGHGRPLDTVVSNLGHLLWSRAASPEHAASTARLLLSPASFSGFGVRTLAERQPVYNPLSYHNGTVWPHDNALIARGFSNYGLGDAAARVFDGIYEAMGYFRDGRLPELFCGMGRKNGPLVRYPVACSPQAWAAAAPFLLLQSLLGIHIDAPRAILSIRNPRLPPYIRRLEIHSMRVGNSLVSLRFRRVGNRTQVDPLDVTGAALRTEIEID